MDVKRLKSGFLPMFMSACALIGAGCHAAGKYYDDPNYLGVYFSPFDESGALTPWAQAAVDRGIGRELKYDTSPYPANQRDPERAYPLDSVRPAHARDANAAAGLLGGWQYLADTSTRQFTSVDALALDLYTRSSTHDFYASALNATMVIYPELRGRYYTAIQGRD